MDISFQICGLIVSMFVAFFFFKEKKIPTISSKIFEKLTISALIAPVLDIGSVLCAKYYEFESASLVAYYVGIGLAKLFYALLIYMAFLSISYSLSEIGIKLGKFSYAAYILCGISFVTPIDLGSKTTGYFTGFNMMFCYAICFAVILTSIVLVTKYRKKLSLKKKEGTAIWAIVWFSAAICQGLWPEMYLVTLSCAFGVFILFIELENPEGKIDANFGAFRAFHLADYARFCVYNEQKCFVATFSVKNAKELRIVKNSVPKNFYLFKDTDTYFYVAGPDKFILMTFARAIANDLVLPVAVYEEAQFENFEVLLPFLKRMVEKERENTVKIYTFKELLVEEEEEKTKEEIVDALNEKRIVAFIQPIYNVKKEMFTSGECLCRLRRRGGEYLAPYKFIPIAEKCGLISEIETRMFENMCKAFKEVEHLGVDYLEANLSVKKGETKNLLEEYLEILSVHSVKPDQINLEITETDAIEEKAAILKNMKEMILAGFSFSLDDFGSGESNLGYIIEMPVSIIKFDREITKKAIAEERARIVVQNAVNMAHDLGIKVVAEGVETESDFEVCKSIGVDYIQGYYFSKPLPVDEFVAFLSKHNHTL